MLVGGTTPHPTKPDRKDMLLRIRVSAEQRALLREAAREENLDLSTWLRQLGLQAAKRTLRAGRDEPDPGA